MGNVSYSNVSLSNRNKNKGNNITTGEYTDIECLCSLEKADVRENLNDIYPQCVGGYSPCFSGLLGILTLVLLSIVFFVDGAPKVLFMIFLLSCVLYITEAYYYWKACHKHLFGNYVQCEEGLLIKHLCHFSFISTCFVLTAT